MKKYRIKARLCDADKTLKWLHKELVAAGLDVSYQNVSMAVSGYRQNETSELILETANLILERINF